MTPEEIAEVERPVPMGPGAVWTLTDQKGRLLAEVKRLRAVVDQTIAACSGHLGGLTDELAEAEADRDRAVSALNEHGRSAVGISGDLEDGINADHLMATAERDGLLAALAATEADRDRARDAAVEMEQQLAEIKRFAYMGGQDAETVRRTILSVFERERRALNTEETP